MLDQAIRTVYELDQPTPANEPTLLGYYGRRDRPDELAKWRRYYEDMLQFARVDPAGLDTVEIGSGLGFALLLLADYGARAHGVEIVSWQVDYVKAYLEHLPAYRHRVEVKQGRAESLPYESEQFDLLLSTEAISHYLDYQPFLSEAHRVLKSGGTLLITDGNNGLCPAVRKRNRAMWASHEGDYREVAEDSPWRLRDRREEIIREAFPQLTADAAELAERTAGMVRGEIIDAVRIWVEGGPKPTSSWRPGMLTVHPTHEMVMERMFNPYKLAREIRAHGFKTRMRGHWGGAGGSKLVRAADSLLAALTPLTLASSKAFWISAVKN
jgi:SAM-dependent methyltransferase